MAARDVLWWRAQRVSVVNSLQLYNIEQIVGVYVLEQGHPGRECPLSVQLRSELRIPWTTNTPANEIRVVHIGLKLLVHTHAVVERFHSVLWNCELVAVVIVENLSILD